MLLAEVITVGIGESLFKGGMESCSEERGSEVKPGAEIELIMMKKLGVAPFPNNATGLCMWFV